MPTGFKVFSVEKSGIRHNIWLKLASQKQKIGINRTSRLHIEHNIVSSVGKALLNKKMVFFLCTIHVEGACLSR